jgi:hypothetical protein
MMKRLHEDLKIPLGDLIQLDPVPWKKQPKPEKTGGKPKVQSRKRNEEDA